MKKLLVLSDLHYPQIRQGEISRIVEKEEADEVVFLGDCVYQDDRVSEFLEIMDAIKSRSRVAAFIRGDEDSALLPSIKSFKISFCKRNFVFVHGHQFNFGSEGFTEKIVSLLQRANGTFPLFTYSVVAKVRERTQKDEFLILGHTHALQCFPRLRVACAGCLTNVAHLYHDRGYIVIEESSLGRGASSSMKRGYGVSLRLESLSPDNRGSRIFQL
jgi:predicted phosphodiesterase